MKAMNDFSEARKEAHVRLICDGLTLHSDGLPSGPDSLPLPSFYYSGLCAVFTCLAALIPGLSCISVLGIWQEDPKAPFIAFDLWAQVGEEGFYLSMSTAGSLFQQNGVPYFHLPLYY